MQLKQGAAMPYSAGLLVLMASALVCTAMVLLLARLAPALGLVDRPTARKTHDLPVPAVGGIAIYAGLLPFVLASAHPAAYGLAAALALVALVGAIDDRTQIPPRVRIVLEALAAMVLVANGESVRYLGDLFGWGPLGTAMVAPLFTVVCVIGTINAFNMIDGLDGLAGSLALVACGWFTAIALATGRHGVAMVGIATIGVLTAFLAFNLRTRFRARASVFMGDAGSMVLGLLLAWFAIELAGKEASALTPIGAVWILAVPFVNIAAVVFDRLRNHVSPCAADHRHFHHLLVDGGMPVEKTVALAIGAATASGAIGAGFPLLGIPEWVMLAAFGLLVACACRWLAHAYAARSRVVVVPRFADALAPAAAVVDSMAHE